MGNATPRGGISQQQDGRELHSRGSCSVSAAIAPIVLAFLYMQARGKAGVGWTHTGFVSGGALPPSCSKKPAGTRVAVGGGLQERVIVLLLGYKNTNLNTKTDANTESGR